MKLRSTLNRALAVLAATLSCTAVAQDQAGDKAITGNPEAARSKVSMCIGCHGIEGYKASFPEVYHVPKIAGQNAEYIVARSEEHTSELQSRENLVCRLLLEKQKASGT